MKQLYTSLKTAAIVAVFSLLSYKVFSQTISTIAGNGKGTYNGDSMLATQAQFFPEAIATDKMGNLFISDLDHSRLRKVDANGIIYTIAGNGKKKFSGDGGLAINATLNYNWGIAFDTAQNLYIVDDGESRIRRITVDGFINTIAGIDTVNSGGYNGDSILAINARLDHPSYVSVDTIGNIYISDQNLRIRKIGTDGIISTIAGKGINGYSGDGGLAVNARIGTPFGIVSDNEGNIYFTDIDHYVVRKIDKNGIISTIAGNGIAGYSGDGGLASLASLIYPAALAISNNGILFIADTYNNVIRKVDTTGIITTVVGNGTAGFSGDGGLATKAKLNLPVGLAFDNMNNLLIADYGNARIRKVTSDIILPVTFTAFTAVNDNNSIKISWQTTNEINIAYYNVQRSIDGNNFITIARIEAAGNSSNTKNYSYTDEGAAKLNVNKLFYRLQEIDKDGQTKYSSIQSVNFINGHLLFSVSPNPAKNFINVISSYNVMNAQVRITDINGKTLFISKENFNAGQPLKISVSQFQSAVLFIRIVSNDKQEQFKIFKE